MIFKELIIENFGIYNGRFTYDLLPIQIGDYDRPVIVIRGKNGVGKSTLLEAIRLCFHGSLVLGNRISRTDYLEYLENRIHRTSNPFNTPDQAIISILFDYVSAGRKATYKVSRTWWKQSGKIVEDVSICENGHLLSDLNTEQADVYLREILPPSSTDVFFFDSERLHTLADDENSTSFFGETVKSLFGLHLVERLVNDLNIFLSRNSKERDPLTQTNLNELTKRFNELEIEKESCVSSLANIIYNRDNIEKQVLQQEHRIATEGNIFSKRRTEFKLEEQRLAIEIEKQKTIIQDLTSGLMPFAISPVLCEQVRDRLLNEEKIERQQISNQLFTDSVKRLELDMIGDQFWSNIDISLNKDTRNAIFSSIRMSLEKATYNTSISDNDVIFQYSERERNSLLSWIDQSLTSIPERFVYETNRLTALEDELKTIKYELSRIPEDDVIKPLMEELNAFNQLLGSLNQQYKDHHDRLDSIETGLEQLRGKLHVLHQKLAESDIVDKRMQMAAKTQLALKDYEKELLYEKLLVLQKLIVSRFNDLCRKESFLDSVEIDPINFQITLHKHGRPFQRNELSAGEKQLFATAQMWALREISSLPIPLIIDTPVGRLDTEHRQRMIRNFFPKASHQVILLTTDAEFDETAIMELDVNIARIYDLEYDHALGTTSVSLRNSIGENMDDNEEILV